LIRPVAGYPGVLSLDRCIGILSVPEVKRCRPPARSRQVKKMAYLTILLKLTNIPELMSAALSPVVNPGWGANKVYANE
jgi:hypothetical protein